MKVILAFALFVAVASAASVPGPSQSCEQKNEVLKNALHRLAKEKMAISDCGTCFADVLSAATDCTDGAWLQCIEDILGAGNPCVSCVCELVSDICGLLGCDWSC